MGVSKSWLRYPPPRDVLLDAAFSLGQQPIAFCLGTSVPATCGLFCFSFLFRQFSSLRPPSFSSFFALDCPTRCAACCGDVTIAVAYCILPCTMHIGWGFVEAWRGPVCLAALDQCFPWEVIIEPMVELHAASLNSTVQCRVESTEDQSCVSRCCVLSGSEHPRKNHMVGIVLSSIVFSTASIAPNSRCFEGLLLVFDSDYSGLWTLAADDHTSLQATLFSRASTKPQLVILC